MKKPKVAAIVPAFNEEKTIADVVKVLCSSELIDKVIVISDGSTDKTKERATKAGATVYELPKTTGKGQAMLHALKHTKALVIAFFDADLIGLTQDHVERLLFPVINGARIMNVGVRDRGQVISLLTHRMPLIGGERAMMRQVIEGVPSEYLQGYMIESALNYYCRSNKYPYGSVDLPGLSIRMKFDKVGVPTGMVQYIKMYLQVFKAMLIVRLARLFRKF